MLPGKQYTPAHYLAMALRWKWVIIVPFLLGSYVALVYSSRLPNIYQSDMLIQVVPQRIPSSFVQSTVTLRTVDRLSALTEQILSRTELERLITEMDLYPEARARLPMQDVVENMRRSQIVIDPVLGGPRGDADSFYIRFSYPDPTVARRVTERLGGLFIDVNQQDRSNLAQATSQFLVSALDEARRKLEETELRLQRFREQNAGRLPTQLAYNMQAMQNGQMRVQAIVESLARDRDRLLNLERMLEDTRAQVIIPSPAPATPATQDGGTSPVVPGGTTTQQLAAARTALTAFELRLKPEHPDVVRTKSLIAKLEAQLEQERLAGKDDEAGVVVPVDPREAARQDRLKTLSADIDDLKRQIARKEIEEQQVRASIADLQRRIEQVPGVESDWIALTRDYDTQSAAYKELLSKTEDARLASNLEERQIGEQFKILDPARTPVRPAGVDRLQINFMGAATGLGIGLLLAALLELRDRTFHHADDIVDVLKLPVIALVPQVIGPATERRNRIRRRLAAATVAVLVIAGGYGFWAMKLWRFVV